MPAASPVPCECASVDADVAVVAVEAERRKPIGGRCLALLLGRLGLLHHGGQIFAIGVGLADRRIHVNLIEGRVGRLVGQR